jgi:hypothetical protein
MKEGCDGQAEGMGDAADGSSGDAFAGAAAGRQAGASAAVLGGNRAWDDERAGGTLLWPMPTSDFGETERAEAAATP